jgi:hypothetical protein
MNSYLMWPMLEIVIQASSMDVRILGRKMTEGASDGSHFWLRANEADTFRYAAGDPYSGQKIC